MTIARRELKIVVKGQVKGWLGLARTVTRSICPRGPDQGQFFSSCCCGVCCDSLLEAICQSQTTVLCVVS